MKILLQWKSTKNFSKNTQRILIARTMLNGWWISSGRPSSSGSGQLLLSNIKYIKKYNYIGFIEVWSFVCLKDMYKFWAYVISGMEANLLLMHFKDMNYIHNVFFRRLNFSFTGSLYRWSQIESTYEEEKKKEKVLMK